MNSIFLWEMKVSVSKRNSNTLDISLNSEGKKLVYNTAVQKEPNQINNSNNNEQNPSIQNPASPPPPKLESKPSLNVILPKKDNKISFQFTKSTSTPTSQSPTNQKTDNKFHYKPEEQNLTETSNKQLKFEDENPETIYKTKIQQKNYITTTRKLIDEIKSNPPEKIANKLQSNIELLWEMLKAIILFDDSVIKETNILLSFINLFLNNSITENPQLNSLYIIFYDTDKLLIGPKLLQYFNSTVDSSWKLNPLFAFEILLRIK